MLGELESLFVHLDLVEQIFYLPVPVGGSGIMYLQLGVSQNTEHSLEPGLKFQDSF